MTQDMLTELLMAGIGSLGFGLIFHINGYKLLITALGGVFNWYIYLLAFAHYNDRILGFFLSALATALLGEVLARWLKTPVITLTVPMLIPLVPGGDLYYTTLALVQSDTARVAEFGTRVVWEVCAMSLGMIIAACSVQIFWKIIIYMERRLPCRKR
ncbi:MAG: threonine/serine exporter family protein [Clostridia bacterium]|nr:threonine/serine exporter family protein [Clostridia bacterium]